MRSSFDWRRAVRGMAALGLVLGLVAGAGRAAARTANTQPGSCDGFANYAGELQSQLYQLVLVTDMGGQISEVEISVQLQNLRATRFRAASLLPDLPSLADLGVIQDATAEAADFGAIDEYASAVSSTGMKLRLPSANVAALLARLQAGLVPITVHADERNVLAPNVRLDHWSSFEDGTYLNAFNAGANRFVLPPPPYPSGATYTLSFLHYFDDGISKPLDSLQPGEILYLAEDLAEPLTHLPDIFRSNIRVLDVDKTIEPSQGGNYDHLTIWTVEVEVATGDTLPSMIQTGSYCMRDSGYVDSPVQATRMFSLDGDTIDDETRDGFSHPIRFNAILFANGALTLSGQVQGHVLKPHVEVRVRDGGVRVAVDLDTDISMSAELTALAEVGFQSEPPVDLWTLCFPLPDLPIGPMNLPLNLQLAHTIAFEGTATAGAVVGIQKHFEQGYTVGYDDALPAGSKYFSQPRHVQPSPVELTPPRLVDDTGVTVEVSTELRSTLRTGARYPICNTGPGAFLATKAFARLDVTPAIDPWWSLGHGVEAYAGLDLQFFGTTIASYQTSPPWTLVGGEKLTSNGPLFGAGAAPAAAARVSAGAAAPAQVARSAGEDQRWAVAIDDIAVPNGVSLTGIAALPDGSAVVIANEPVSSRTPLLKLDRFGALQWLKEYGAGRTPRQIHVLADGTILVAGTTPALSWIARHDAAGNVLWSADVDLSRSDIAGAGCGLRDAVAIEQSPGHYDYVVVGQMGSSVVTRHDGCAFRVNENRSVPWAKVYQEDRLQNFADALLASDGTIALAGTGEAGPDLFSVGNGLFAKLDAASGAVVWAKTLPDYRLTHLNAIAESPDGTLFAVGNAFGTINTNGAALVARIGADGSDARHAMLLEDVTWEQLLVTLPGDDWVDTAGGDTAYDELFDIAPAGDGFVVVGRTGLGAATSAWAAKLDANLGAEWFSVFDGSVVDSLGGVAPTADGILVSGYSASLPERDGGSGENQIWVMKLPFAGKIAFLPSVAMTSRYVEPGVRYTSIDANVVPIATVAMDVPFVVFDATVDSSVSSSNLLGAASAYCVEKLTETGHVSILDACLEDADGDGVDEAVDNCPHVANADQVDTGGVGSGSAPDGIGNACQCGDVNGDGFVTLTDAVIVTRAQLAPPTATLAHPELCDVGGGASPSAQDCTLTDAVILRRAQLAPPTATIAQTCAPAVP